MELKEEEESRENVNEAENPDMSGNLKKLNTLKTLHITSYTNAPADDSFHHPSRPICDTILVSWFATNVIAMSTYDTTILVFFF